MAINEEQSKALQIVLQGHNLLLLGAAGTGKTHAVRHIVKELRGKKKNVQVTATTGIACSLYGDAATIHKWSGIGDGRYEAGVIGSVVQNNVKYRQVRERIVETDVLVVDECSMMSQKMFASLQAVCRLKNASLPFGGIQLIFCGDFRQLPPVPNRLYDEDGEFCFMHPDFADVFPHRVTLSSSQRQGDTNLITAIRECSLGHPSIETISYIKELQRPLPQLSTKLYATNDQVDAYNRKCIMECPGDLYGFIAKDDGQLKHLDSILAPKKLWLKKGAPVMLLRNLSKKLVNGLAGKVVEFTEGGPIIHFPTVNATIPLDRFRFSVYSPSKNTDIAVREQFPVKLSYAMTIHKAQGLTLDNVEVDCRGVFKPGHLSVAMGRVRSTDNLRVINFSPQSCKPQPDHVNAFLAGETKDLETDRSCCVLKRESVHLKQADTYIYSVTDIEDIEAVETIEEENEFDEDFDDAIVNLMQDDSSNTQLPDELNLDEILENIKCETTITTIQQNTNKILREIDNGKYRTFVKKEFSYLSELMSTTLPGLDAAKPVTSKHQDVFMKKAKQHLCSTEFRMCSMDMFDTTFTEDHAQICCDISDAIQEFLLEQKVSLYPTSSGAGAMRQVTSASHSRIRYIAGHCVAKTRYKFQKQKHSHMYDTSASGQAAYEEAVTAVRILDALRVDEHFILATTSDPYSLEDTQRRQNINHSLTHVSDELHEIFKKLTEKGLSLLTEHNLNEKGSGLFQYLNDIMISETEIFQQFEELVTLNETLYREFEEVEVDERVKKDQTRCIFSKFVKKMLMILVNQFRKDILDKFRVSKKMAHRKQIQVSGKGGKAKKTASDGGESVIQGPSKPKKRKSVSDLPVASSSAAQPVASTSKEVEESVDEEEEVMCSKCQTPGSDTQWVQCDGCSLWLHRICAGLKHRMKWKKATKKGAKFYCVECQ